MAMPHDDFVYYPLGSILRGKLALLDGAFDENVVALVKRQHDVRKVPVERKTIPISPFLPLTITILEAIRLS